MIKAIIKSNPLEFPVLIPSFKQVLMQVTNALIKFNKHLEFTIRYRRIKTCRGHKKAIIAILSYDPDRYLAHTHRFKAIYT